jgi:hypothetical protein
MAVYPRFLRSRGLDQLHINLIATASARRRVDGSRDATGSFREFSARVAIDSPESAGDFGRRDGFAMRFCAPVPTDRFRHPLAPAPSP